MKRIIKVEGKWYNLLGMYGGNCYLGDVYDIGNNVVKSGVIWEMQPFEHQSDKWYGNILFNFFRFARWLSKFYYL